MKTLEIIYYAMTVIVAIWISIKDFGERMIPNESIILLGILGIVRIIMGLNKYSFISAIIGMVFAGIIFLIPMIVTHKIGSGDAKLAAVIGLNVGIRGMMYTIVFMGIGVIVYFTVKSFRKKTIDFRLTIPLGPFLMMGMVVSLMYGA